MGKGASSKLDRATREPSPAVSALRASIASAPRPGWLKCVKSNSNLFTVGVVYEVHHYCADGTTWVVTDRPRGLISLPVTGVTLEPYDPWWRYRTAQGIEAPSGGETQSGSTEGESPVAEGHAPKHPHQDNQP